MKRLVLSSLAALALLAACGSPPSANAPPAGPPGTVMCDGAPRTKLSCESEVTFDARSVEGGFKVLGFGEASAKTEVTALRQVDDATQSYVVQWKRLCEEYNACVVDRDGYATRSENLRRRIAKVPELYEGIKGASTPAARAMAIGAAYETLVPDGDRTDLELRFSVLAKRPSESAMVAVGPGSSLPTDTRVGFVVSASRPAYVYLFQRTANGAENVIFPSARIPVSNPIPAGTEVRIPAGDASYRVNEKDIGAERVYVVASLQRIPQLEDAVAKLGAGDTQAPALQGLATASQPSSSGCKTRALELDGPSSATPGCVRSRGLDLPEAPAAGPGAGAAVSLRARTEAADSTIVKIFSFQHTAN